MREINIVKKKKLKKEKYMLIVIVLYDCNVYILYCNLWLIFICVFDVIENFSILMLCNLCI